MIVTLKRLRPFAWPRLAHREKTAQKNKAVVKPRMGIVAEFEQMLGHVVEPIIRESTRI
jgi:hypothetical protein